MRAVRLDGGAIDALLDACRTYLLPQPRVASIAVVALASLGVAVFALGARALARNLVALARFRRTVHVSDRLTVRGRVVRSRPLVTVRPPAGAAPWFPERRVVDGGAAPRRRG